MPDQLPLPVNFAYLARQIAMDILPLDDVLETHKLSDEQWTQIQANPVFQATLTDMIADWNSAANTENRVRIKAATGIEASLEPTIAACMDPNVPLGQKIEGLKFLAKLGKLMDQPEYGGGTAADRVQINIYTGHPSSSVVIDALPIRRDDVEDLQP